MIRYSIAASPAVGVLTAPTTAADSASQSEF